MASPGSPPLRKGAFYRILDGGRFLVLEDSTREKLTVQGRSPDEGMMMVEADMGTIYGLDGIGRRVPIRWYFPKDGYDLEAVLMRAREIEERHAALRELGCPGG